jgi:ABC-type uncharacterized transport system ATPase subunit
MGENGAGKGTLIKILAGIYHPDSGEIILDAKPVHAKFDFDPGSGSLRMVLGTGAFADQTFQRQFANLCIRLLLHKISTSF